MRGILALFLTGALCAASFSAQAKTVTLVADLWCPYNCAPDAKQQGFMIDIARRIFAKHGIEVEYKTLPWTRAIEAARSGKYTAIVGASTNDAPDFIFPTIEQGWMGIQFFTLSSSRWNYLGKSSLIQVRLGAVAGYAYGPTVDSYIQFHQNDPARVQLVEGDGALERNISSLMEDKIDAVLEDGHVMNYYLQTHGMTGKIKTAGQLPISDQNNLYIAFSPKESAAKKYATMMTEGMAAMRESGELAAILEEYGIQDWRR